MKPIIRLKSAKKVIKYFFDEDYKKFKSIVIGIRNSQNKINLFDDESFTLDTTRDEFITNNFNADPSKYREAGKGVAILRPGVHFYRISFHHTGDDDRRYVALRPATSNEQLPVWRYDGKGNLYLDFGTAINIHAGGDITTGSRGCQTFPKRQYYGWLDFVAKPFGLQVPRGIITRRKIGSELFDKLKKGIGKIPYILITQEQFEYIQNLPENEFDSPADLRYQLQNFVNIPKIPRIEPVLTEARQPQTIVEEDDASEDFANGNQTISDFVPNAIEDLTGAGKEQIDAVAETVKEAVSDGKKQTEKAVTEITSTFEPKNIPAFIPRFGKQWLLALFPGAGFLTTIGAYIQHAPQWLVFVLGGITGIALWKFLELVITHRKTVGDFIVGCYRTTSDPKLHNLIPVSASAYLGQSVFGSLEGSRFEALEYVLDSKTETETETETEE